jgi:hypothetical protein
VLRMIVRLSSTFFLSDNSDSKTKKMSILIEIQTFPPLLTFALAASENGLLIEACENYNKGSYRNKYRLLSSTGPILLSIPLVKGKNNAQKIREVEISYAENWQKNHLRTLQTNYGKSPFFDEYFPLLQNHYSMDFKYLFDFNSNALDMVFRLLGLSSPINFTENYIHRQIEKTECLLDYRNIITPKSKDTEYYFMPYPQVFEDRLGFVPNLSILDLLFCMGPESLIVLKSGGNNKNSQ